VLVLIVEDSPTQALYLQQVLENVGYTVAVTRNGAEALHYLDSNQPTLVISDIVMPEIDGYELCRRIKRDERFAQIPVMLITFLSDPVDILRGLECGADNFITKPYVEKVLISRIQYLLINQDLRRRAASGVGIELYFAGQKHFLTAERMQIIDLLISSYETAVMSQNQLEETCRELRRVNDRLSAEIEHRKLAETEQSRLISELQDALAQVKKLSGMLPICMACKKIRDDRGYWQQIEAYIRDRSEAQFSHGICPECARKLYPEIADKLCGGDT
jgi:two-component system, OmpR family, response regulator VanR